MSQSSESLVKSQIASKPRVGIFVDVQNIYYTCRQSYGKNFDYNAFWAHVSERYDIECAFAYAIYRGDDKQSQFQNILRAIGFEVKLKPFIQRKDGSAKGDWDVGITIDMLEHGKNLIVLFYSLVMVILRYYWVIWSINIMFPLMYMAQIN